MGTRSNIIVERRDGKWSRVYCHWDGYPSHHGPILTEHYQTQQKAEALVRRGDMSSLAENCTKPQGHSFDHPKDGYCVYYGRDRGEKDTQAEIFDTLAEAWPDENSGAEYVYVWKRAEHAWFVGDADEGQQTLQPLAAVVKGEAEPPKPNVKAFGGNFVIGTRK